MTHIFSVDYLTSSERANKETVSRQRKILLGQPALIQVLNAMPNGVVVLNQHRQILFLNSSMAKTMGSPDLEDIAGQRFGEAIKCIHSSKESGGCGTTEFCRTCGGAQAILESQSIGRSVRECRITTIQNGTEDWLELLIWATRIQIDGEQLVVFAAKDISHEKRRRFLERIFFHDVLNTAGGVKGFADLIRLEASGEIGGLADALCDASDHLINEIQAHRELTAAENHELRARPIRLISRMFLEDIVFRYAKQSVAQGKAIVVDEGAASAEFSSDPGLLGRVISNLIKNALEASREDDTINVNCQADNTHVVFSVQNPAFMPRDVQLQLFQRSFSTKGAGRGLGVYSVKLLTERYLKGCVEFSSNPDDGTTFRIILPLNL